jgi:hypothetical protein
MWGIEHGDRKEQLNISEKLINEILINDNNVMELMNILKNMNEFASQIDVMEDVTNPTRSSISFDVIRIYNNDPTTGLLTDVIEDVNLEYKLYSQVVEESTVLEIRRLCNDSDFNRMQYILRMFEKSVTLHKDRMFNNAVQISNLLLLYMLIALISESIETHSANDLIYHYMSMIIDITIRSSHTIMAK